LVEGFGFWTSSHRPAYFFWWQDSLPLHSRIWGFWL
jgi:hypothetical protein